MPSPPTKLGHLPFLLLAAAALLAALWGGLVRLGWSLPVLPLRLAGVHGALMIPGFLGSLISLERAVALRQQSRSDWFYYLPPLTAGLGALLLVSQPLEFYGRLLNTVGALGMVWLCLIMLRRQPTLDHLVIGLGAAGWLAGNALWLLGRPLYQAVPWWAGFLILTIAGERLELSRVLRHGRRARGLFVTAAALFLLGLLLSLWSLDWGLRLAGLGLVSLAAWLWRFDIARRTIRTTGLTRYIAACLLPGYLWLAAGGLLWLYFGGLYTAGPVYDALLHVLFLGFVFSMIFGHAPIILPAVLGVQVRYSPVYYLHLTLLHLSLVLRLVGDLGNLPALRQWGGLLNETAVLLFIVATAVVTRVSARSAAPSPVK